MILLARAEMAADLLFAAKNIGAIRLGRVAFLHIEPSDMLVHDILRVWRQQLEVYSHNGDDLGDAGQSLLIMGALPITSTIDFNSSIFEKVGQSTGRALSPSPCLSKPKTTIVGIRMGSPFKYFLQLAY